MAPKPRNEWNGPDGIDIATMIREMQALHVGSTVKVEIMSDGAMYAGSSRIRAYAMSPQLVGPGQCWKGEVLAVWPNNQSRTLEGAIFKLLHELDAKMGRELWKQEAFA